MDSKTKQVIELVGQYYGYSYDGMMDIQNKKHRLSHARHICWRILRADYNMKVVALGDMFNRDYSTIVQQTNKLRGSQYSIEIDSVRRLIANGGDYENEPTGRS